MNILGKGLKKQKGFTLIELLMVIAIVGILAAVVISSLNSARERSRDAQRIRNIQEIHNAVELYISQNGHAPDFGDSSCSDPLSGNTSCYTTEFSGGYPWSELESELSPYISKLPKDPCGIKCYQKSNTKYEGYFAYYYTAPALLGAYYQDQGFNINTSIYRLYAQNLEAKDLTSFGFGEGSF